MNEPRILVHALLLSLSLVTAGCATLPAVPKMEGQASAAVGIAVKVIGPLKFPTYNADVVYFTKVCADRKQCDTTVYSSNYARDGRVYWLNAPPGNYAAIAASFSVLNAPDVYIVYFPQKLIDLAQVHPEAGKLVYAGDYVLGSSIGVCPGDADDVQLSYAEQFEPGSPKCGLFKSTMGKLAKSQVVFVGAHAYPIGGYKYHYRGAIHEANRDPAHEKNFLMSAREDLADGGWQILLNEAR